MLLLKMNMIEIRETRKSINNRKTLTIRRNANSEQNYEEKYAVYGSSDDTVSDARPTGQSAVEQHPAGICVTLAA